MSRHLSNQEEMTYRVVLVAPDSHLLLVDSAATGKGLPRFNVQGWGRPAEQIQTIFANKWGLRVVVLDFLIDSEHHSPCVVVELLSPYPCEGLTFASINSFGLDELTDDERLTIEAMCACDVGTRGPFSRLGWISEAVRWIREAVGGDYDVSGDFQQYNAGGSFALVRFETKHGRGLWLKATGDPNRHEFSITSVLSTLCPNYLPPLIVMRRDWNAWVMEDAGEPLDRRADVSLFERVLISMAELQKMTISHTDRLISAGAFPQSLAVLRQDAGEMIDYFRQTMEQQTSTKVLPLDEKRLSEIESVLVDACDSMEQLEIPETVLHNDLNLGNVLLRADSTIFADWCEVCVGNPFVTLDHFLSRIFKDVTDRPGDREKLVASYKRSWLDSLPPVQIDRAIVLAPLLAIASYLYGRGALLRSPRRFEPSVQSYARSLARHMDRAARSPELLAAL
jgi:Phosphotransferase enzyme family